MTYVHRRETFEQGTGATLETVELYRDPADAVRRRRFDRDRVQIEDREATADERASYARGERKDTANTFVESLGDVDDTLAGFDERWDALTLTEQRDANRYVIRVLRMMASRAHYGASG